jgi:hypothetical protein
LKPSAIIEQSKTVSGRERMPDLDGLRAVAISLVLVAHFVTLCLPFQPARNLAQFGWVGVDLFFVIPGFLIGGILFDHRTATNYYRVFYLRRFCASFHFTPCCCCPWLECWGWGCNPAFRDTGWRR